ncbi:MAG: nickel pincer cofactor biosynthesis protein LarC [Gemmatimonadaceae bacterium]
MRVAIFDAFSGISGDMTLGALLQVGLDPDWLRALPATLGLSDIGVRIREVARGEIVCQKVDFDIPPQPHGRHVRQIRDIVAKSGAPEHVREKADRAFTAIANAEGEIHGLPPEKVHLHEVGSVDAILDIVGAIWGLEQLGVERVYVGTIALGDGMVKASHGVLPVPAPATLKLLEGQSVRPGPEGSGELVTPTGAALVRVLSSGPPPAEYTPVKSGFGAGTKDFVGRANALRIVLADAVDSPQQSLRFAHDDDAAVEDLVELACDIDDMSAEYLAAVADRVRDAGALDVVLLAAAMKRGRPGTRVEVLSRPADAARIEELLLIETTTIGVRRRAVRRRALPRELVRLTLLGHEIGAKLVTLPNGRRRAKPEFADVQRVARATGRPLQDISRLAAAEAERHSER